MSWEEWRPARRTTMAPPSSLHSRTAPGPTPRRRRTAAGTDTWPCAVSFEWAIGDIHVYYHGNAPGSTPQFRYSPRRSPRRLGSSLRLVHGCEDRRQGRQHLAEAPANPGDVRFRLLGDFPSSHLGDELLARGRHQQGRVDLQLERVDAPGPGLTIRGHDVAPGVAADVLVRLEAVTGEDRGRGRRERRGARRIVARADDHLVVLHPPRAPGVTVEEQRVPVGLAQLGEQELQGRVVGVVERPQALLEVAEPERTREDRRVAHGVGAHYAAPGAHLAVLVLEVVAAAIDVHEHARERCRQDRGPILI